MDYGLREVALYVLRLCPHARSAQMMCAGKQRYMVCRTGPSTLRHIGEKFLSGATPMGWRG